MARARFRLFQDPSGRETQDPSGTRAEGMVGLGSLPLSPRSDAFAVSGDGSVIAGNSNPCVFRWSPDTGMVEMEYAFFFNFVRRVSADGSVVVGTNLPTLSPDTRQPVRWAGQDGAFSSLGTVSGGSLDSDANDVNGDGTIIIGVTGLNSEWEPFIWDEVSGMRPLLEVVGTPELEEELAAWSQLTARGISDDGCAIAGAGLNPSGRFEAWLLELDPVLCPEPGGLLTALGGLGSVLVATRQRNRRSRAG